MLASFSICIFFGLVCCVVLLLFFLVCQYVTFPWHPDWVLVDNIDTNIVVVVCCIPHPYDWVQMAKYTCKDEKPPSEDDDDDHQMDDGSVLHGCLVSAGY